MPEDPERALSFAREASRGLPGSIKDISYSGDLRHDPMHCVPWLRKGGVRVIAVTNSEASPLAEEADHVLSFPRLEHHHAKIASFYSGACVSLVLDTLYATCFSLAYDEGVSRQGSVLASMADRIPQDFGG